jgi:hypothetical protein
MSDRPEEQQPGECRAQIQAASRAASRSDHDMMTEQKLEHNPILRVGGGEVIILQQNLHCERHSIEGRAPMQLTWKTRTKSPGSYLNVSCFMLSQRPQQLVRQLYLGA